MQHYLPHIILYFTLLRAPIAMAIEYYDRRSLNSTNASNFFGATLLNFVSKIHIFSASANSAVSLMNIEYQMADFFKDFIFQNKLNMKMSDFCVALTHKWMK